ncbi:unnamed protein product [Zymoseptoria tritici ST99CH_3D7]|uniref:Uncharacterized protein n=1 Tax=Zymoseptoria tritici (strain ST99CH_3D7) TaxID=1276538 RepID=A0A1X7RFW9_ZYMT9|nr:unnamed protein product [Zymoseptoria tritici ST99CH_3D7]
MCGSRLWWSYRAILEAPICTFAWKTLALISSNFTPPLLLPSEHRHTSIMCQFEVIHFQCGHSGRRLIKHCHFARNDPNHQCFGAWSIKREWISANQICRECGQQANIRRAQQAQLRL